MRGSSLLFVMSLRCGPPANHRSASLPHSGYSVQTSWPNHPHALEGHTTSRPRMRRPSRDLPLHRRSEAGMSANLQIVGASKCVSAGTAKLESIP